MQRQASAYLSAQRIGLKNKLFDVANDYKLATSLERNMAQLNNPDGDACRKAIQDSVLAVRKIKQEYKLIERIWTYVLVFRERHFARVARHDQSKNLHGLTKMKPEELWLICGLGEDKEVIATIPYHCAEVVPYLLYWIDQSLKSEGLTEIANEMEEIKFRKE
ncbi:MAG: hypothetical protein JSU85_05990 [Candidatus Zixiibacteriota bacterium]|nr:MAG: hypothetical protein JSU85_05990 [candidate division Zixibacteria bacterium]